MPDSVIPPWVKPESPVELQLVDDSTAVFEPAYSRGRTQRNKYSDPRWVMKMRFRGLSQEQRAAMRRALLNVRGRSGTVRVTPNLPIRGTFPVTEVFTNADLNSTTGWSVAYGTISAEEGSFRVDCSSVGRSVVMYQDRAVTTYAPYVVRAAVGMTSMPSSYAGGTYLGVFTNYAADYTNKYVTQATMAMSGSMIAYPMVFNSTSAKTTQDDFARLEFASYSRCALVDNEQNLIQYSDDITKTSHWTHTGVTHTGDTTAAPDGGLTADTMTEDTSTGGHYIRQTSPASRTSAVADLCYTVCAKIAVGTRGLRLFIGNDGSNGVTGNFDLVNGVAGTPTMAGTATLGRSFIRSLGNGWYRCTVIGRMVAAATTFTQLSLTDTYGGTASYTGTTGAIYLWRQGVAVSSFPFNAAYTINALVTPQGQTGNKLWVKGLPVSTADLLKTGDFFEVNGELKQCTYPLDSNAEGRGLLHFVPAIGNPPADNSPVIILNPMGRFIVSEDPTMTELYGQYTDFDLTLVEVYE